MENIHLTSSDEVPLPPEEVRILDFQAEPYPDRKRVKLTLTFTPFQSYPSGEILILDPSGAEAGRLNIIETIDVTTEITVHLRGDPQPGRYTASFHAFYLEEDISEDDPDQVQGLKQITIGKRSTDFLIP